MNANSVSKVVTFNNVKIKDTFWTAKQKHVICEVIDNGIAQVESEEQGTLNNFVYAGQKLRGEEVQGKFKGMVFQDSDVYKIMEAMSYALQLDADGDEAVAAKQKEFYERLDKKWIPLIQEAQEKHLDAEGTPIDDAEKEFYDGYLQTMYTLGYKVPRFMDFTLHEMYCAGHFYEAAVAYTRAMDYKDLRLFDVAVRNADMYQRLFGYGKWEVYPGHEEIELALVKLAALCEEVQEREPEASFMGRTYLSRAEGYVALAKFFIDIRGKKVNRGYYEEEGSNLVGVIDKYYGQDWVPVTEQRIAAGHSVRAMYLYSGMSDIAALLNTSEYDEAMLAIWADMKSKTYVTGGIGSIGGDSSSEGFGSAYYLPNDNAYAETCANIGSMMWGQRMNLRFGESSYIDTVETALYNSVISGMNFDGDKFFYVNPMSSNADKERHTWFGCACCPPSLMRTITSLGGYIYAQDSKSITVNLYIGNEADIRVGTNQVKLSMTTCFPWYGCSKVTILESGNEEFALKFRIPQWASGKNKVMVNGEEIPCTKEYLEQGYVVIERIWKAGDLVELDFPMETVNYHSPKEVVTNNGLTAVTRGPVVYAAEGNDHEFDITEASMIGSYFKEELVDNVLEHKDTSKADRFGIKKGMVIKTDGKDKDGNTVEWSLIPYYAWNNRGKDIMRVFVKEV